MRLHLVLPACLVVAPLGAQVVLDGPFINERFVLNVPTTPLQGRLPDEGFVEAHCTPLRDYTLDEPHYWTQRRFHRVVLNENEALTTVQGAAGPSSVLEAINSGIREGRVALFRDLTFLEPLEQQAYRPLSGASLLLKTDFAYNDTTHGIEAHIIGLAVESADGAALAVYFPELRHVLREYLVAVDGGVLGLDACFDRWMFIAHAADPMIGGAPGRCANCTMVHEEQAELDALVQIHLVERELVARKVPRKGRRSAKVTGHVPQARSATVEFDGAGALMRLAVRRGKQNVLVVNYEAGVPHGPFREFRPDGGLKQQGQFAQGRRVGAWAAWWDNGNIRSRRQYVDGRLDGEQRVYHPNGQLRCAYGMVGGRQEGAYESFFSDGAERMKGAMRGGLVEGEWRYTIRMDRELLPYLREHRDRLEVEPSTWEDGVLQFVMRYTHEASDTRCPLGVCIAAEGPLEVR